MDQDIKTVIQYPVGATEFDIPFDYLSRKFVRVSLVSDDNRRLLSNITEYRYVSKTRVKLLVATTGFDRVEIRRFTSASERVVDFSDGSVLRANDLNVSQLQSAHIAEEARDAALLAMPEDDAGNLDARNRKIVRLAPGESGTDAVNKDQLDTTLGEAGGILSEVKDIQGDIADYLQNFADDTTMIRGVNWVYNEGSAVGGETTFTIDKDGPVFAVPYIEINGSRQLRGWQFSYEPLTKRVTLAKPLVAGDFVVCNIAESTVPVLDLLAGPTGSDQIGTSYGMTLTRKLINLTNGTMLNLFDFLNSSKIDAIVSGAPTDVTSELQAAMDASRTVWIPAGRYIVTRSIVSGKDSGLVGPGARMVSIDNQSGSHLFIIGAGGYTRGWKPWMDFSITASNSDTVESYAFYYSDRQDSSGSPVYTVGQVYSGIEINAWGRLGGGWCLQECFRVVIRDCGATGLSHPFRLIGSVVQTTIDNFVHNGDGAIPMGTDGLTYGLTTESKKYGNGTVFTPEGLTVGNTRFVKQDVGVKVSGGLYLMFNNVEADYSRYYGFWYNGGSQVSFDNCYVGVQGNRDRNFAGFFVPAAAAGVPEAVNIRGCTVNMAANSNTNAASYSSYGVQIGNSSVAALSTLVDGCYFRGNGYTDGIYVMRGGGINLTSNRFGYSGSNIRVDECSGLTMIGNVGNGSGTYSLTTVNASARWLVVNNSETFTKMSHVNPRNLLALNNKYTSGNIRRVERASSPINTSIPAGGLYYHTVPVNSVMRASVTAGAELPNGILCSASLLTENGVRVTLFNATQSTIVVSTTVYVDVTFDPAT